MFYPEYKLKLNSRKELTQKIVKEVFNYDKETGNLIWKVRKAARLRVGDIAGSIHHGYIQVELGGYKFGVHQLVFLWHHGYLPENEIDHSDRNKLNNRIDNLVDSTHKCNTRNRSLPSNNSSGIIGVFWDNTNNKYCAQIADDKKHRRHLGHFLELIDAACARLAAEQCLKYPSCENGSAFLYVQNYLKA